MKNTKITPIIAILIIAAMTAPAYALSLDLNTTISTKIEQGNKNDNKDDGHNKDTSDMHIKSDLDIRSPIKFWSVNNGTIGKVTAKTSDSLTIQTSSGEIYVVSTTDATVRKGSSNVTSSIISIGDTVYIIGVKNGNSIAASTIITAKSKNEIKPNDDEKRKVYFGNITAKTDSSITIKTPSGDSYLVTAVNAQIWINKAKQSSVSNLLIGDAVMVQGDTSGNTISAKKITSIHFPSGLITGKVTAVNGNNLTIKSFEDKTYTVLATDADVKVKGNKDAEISDISVGSNIIVKGDVDGSTVTASSVTEGKIKIGFFHRIGLFFKGIFKSD